MEFNNYELWRSMAVMNYPNTDADFFETHKNRYQYTNKSSVVIITVLKTRVPQQTQQPI